ncbi:MAG: hypothetical protein ACJ763_10375 [Bdellovibrionia bacterium]
MPVKQSSQTDLSRRNAIIQAVALGLTAPLAGLSPSKVFAATPISSQLPAGDIDTNLTLRVPQDFPTIIQALEWTYRRRIIGYGSITIQVADGVYSSLPIIPLHPDGQKIKLIGNRANPYACQLNFDATKNGCGILAMNGYSLGMIDGFAINGLGAYLGAYRWTDQAFGAGIYATGSGSSITVGPAIRVKDFYYGIRADKNAKIVCQTVGTAYGAEVANAGDIGFFAWGGGYIEAMRSKAFNVGHSFTNAHGVPEMLGACFGVEMGGIGYFDGSYATGGLIAGFLAQTGASLWAHEATSENNNRSGGGVGFLTRQNGTMECAYAISLNNSVGFSSNDGSYMEVTRITANYNAQDGVALDGGKIAGFAPSANQNGGFGFKPTHLSKMNVPGYGGVGNKAGFVYAADPSCVIIA